MTFPIYGKIKSVPNHQPVDNLNIKWFKHLNIERSWGNFMNMTSKSWDITPVTGKEGLCKQGLFCTTRLCDTSKLRLEWLAQSTDIHSPLSAPDSLRSAMESLTHGQLLDGRLASTELPDVFYEYVLHGLEDKGGISTSYNQPTVSPVERCYELAKLHGMNGGHMWSSIRYWNPYNRFLLNP